MLGQALCREAQRTGVSYLAVDRKLVDLERFERLRKIIDEIDVKLIYNCAANINITQCELDPSATEVINCWLPKFLSEYCDVRGCKLVHISSDHFYDSGGRQAHKETESMTLFNNYARQKYEAELLIMAHSASSLILRTSILGYRADGTSLVDWILRQLKQNAVIHGFHDAYTSAFDVATLSNFLLEKKITRLSGVYNICASEVYSKKELIDKIIEKLGLGILSKSVSAKGLKPTRALSCGLNCEKIIAATSIDLPSLSDVIENLNVREEYEKI